jgi:FkbM family methyltransferase
MIESGRLLLGQHKWGIYDVLPHFGPGLMLDIGAGMGSYTRLMMNRSPGSRVISFEPFPGNWPHIAKMLASHDRYTLIKKAVSDNASESMFFNVAMTVKGTEQGWEEHVGYSSAGRLVEAESATTLKVPVTTVAAEVNDHVRFMKIDVQGAETKVLHGALPVIKAHGIDMIFCEFDGTGEIIDFLIGNDYVVFDSEYMLINPKAGESVEANWSINHSKILSSGLPAHFGWPKLLHHAIGDYVGFLAAERKRLAGYVGNDLLAVHRTFLPAFFTGCGKALASLPVEA